MTLVRQYRNERALVGTYGATAGLKLIAK